MTQIGMFGDGRTRAILSYGMGVDSTAIFLRWLNEPKVRTFDLADLVALTAQVGDEYRGTARLVERHILPRMRAAGVRFVQVSRGGPSQDDGVVVHEDSRAPTRVFEDPRYRLSHELTHAGTIPIVASGKRLCTQHFKGFPLDRWLRREVGDAPFRHFIGFNAEELRRAKRDEGYGTAQRHTEYPLIEWGWDRATCERYIEQVVGEPWAKSCCSFCPFAGGSKAKCAAVTARLSTEPERAVEALTLERVALALNPRMKLYKTRSLAGCFGEEENEEILAAAEAHLDQLPWAVYRVRRTWTPTTRDVAVLARGGRAEMEQAVREDGAEFEDGAWRVFVHRRTPSEPFEEMVVAAPALAREKRGPGFPRAWARHDSLLGRAA